MGGGGTKTPSRVWPRNLSVYDTPKIEGGDPAAFASEPKAGDDSWGTPQGCFRLGP
jgi:hypothetical protein